VFLHKGEFFSHTAVYRNHQKKAAKRKNQTNQPLIEEI